MTNPVQNPSFEYPGAASGQAESWTEAYPESPAVAAGEACEEIAAFDTDMLGTEDPTPYEGFIGGWSTNEDAQTGFAISDIVAAFFEYGDHQHENFETSWALPQTVSLSLPRWNHQAQMSYWYGNFVAALFNSGLDDVEDFETDWDSVENAVADLASGTTSSAAFDVAADTHEDFEEEWQDVETAVASLAAGTSAAALFDAGANAFENFEGLWPTIVYP